MAKGITKGLLSKKLDDKCFTRDLFFGTSVPDKIKGNPENLMDIIENNNVTSMLIPYPNDESVWKGLENYADKKISEKKIFTRATRNPLNAGAKYQMWLFTLNTDLNKRIFEVE